MKKMNAREKKEKVKPQRMKVPKVKKVKEKKVKGEKKQKSGVLLEKMAKKTSKTNKNSFEKSKKINLFVFMMSVSLIPLILSIAIVSVLSFSITSTNVKQSSNEMLLTVAKNLASHCVQNEVTIINAAEHYEYLDALKGQDIEVAIIFENMSCVTSIKNENGYRIREIICNEDLFKSADKYEQGYYEDNMVVNEKNYYACFIPVVIDGRVTGVAYASVVKDKIDSVTQDMLVKIISIAVALLIASVLIVLLFSRSVSKAFVRVGERVNALSKGDLKTQKEQKSSLREMHVLFGQTQLMQQNLLDIIGKVKLAATQLTGSIGEVSGLSEDASDRAKQIVDSVDELTKSAEYMNVNVQDIAEQMSEIGVCVNEMSESVDQLYRHSENILETNDVAKTNMDIIMDKSKMSVEAVERIAAQIHETNGSIKRVDEAVAMILSISDETNLLSLNASIEAARAGEHGRGFAVIAEEIFKLSEQSAKGAEMIKQLAKTITEASKKSVDLAVQVQSMILEEQESIKLTRNKYEELSRDIGHSADEIRSIAAKTGELSNYKEKVIENVHNLGAVSQENAASNEEVNGNISEIISQVQNVSANCASMNEMAQQLEESVMFFKD